MPIITVPKPLREKLGDDGADALVDLFNQSEQRQKEDVLEFVEEKFERWLSEEIADVKNLIAEQGTQIQAVRADLIKWVFIFWVGQVGVIIGILFAFFK